LIETETNQESLYFNTLTPEMPVTYSTIAHIQIEGNLYKDEEMPLKEQIGDEKTEEEEYQAIKRPFQPHNKKQKRKHGFLHRLSTRSGRKILENRKRKGRSNMSV
jgi:large subunit ribosomal protein L34